MTMWNKRLSSITHCSKIKKRKALLQPIWCKNSLLSTRAKHNLELSSVRTLPSLNTVFNKRTVEWRIQKTQHICLPSINKDLATTTSHLWMLKIWLINWRGRDRSWSKWSKNSYSWSWTRKLSGLTSVRWKNSLKQIHRSYTACQKPSTRSLMLIIRWRGEELGHNNLLMIPAAARKW